MCLHAMVGQFHARTRKDSLRRTRIAIVPGKRNNSSARGRSRWPCPPRWLCPPRTVVTHGSNDRGIVVASHRPPGAQPSAGRSTWFERSRKASRQAAVREASDLRWSFRMLGTIAESPGGRPSARRLSLRWSFRMLGTIAESTSRRTIFRRASCATQAPLATRATPAMRAHPASAGCHLRADANDPAAPSRARDDAVKGALQVVETHLRDVPAELSGPQVGREPIPDSAPPGDRN